MVKPENLMSTLQNTSASSKTGLEKYSEADFLTFDDDNTVPDLLPAATAGVDFLVTHFPRKLFTFQFFKNNKPGPTLNLPASNKAIILEELLKRSRSGYDVYFMVNEGNGITPEGKKTARCKDAVVSFSYCFIDTDNCPISDVVNYLQSIHLTPSFTIESSANRFHIYFRIEECEKTFKNIQTWLSVQGMLARLGDPAATKENSADTQMADYSRLLRVPGFTHQRKKFISSVISTSNATYTLEDLYAITNAKDFEEYNLQNYGKLVPVHVPKIGDVIENGMRFEAARSYSMSLANTPGTYEEKYNLYTQFIQSFDNTDPEFFENNQLTAKALDLFNTANKKVEIETRSNYDLITASAPVTVSPPSPAHTSATTPALPASYFTSAHNGIGQAIREIMAYSKYPSAPISFGCFLAGLSMMKASRYLTQSGKPCSFYVVIVAPPSYGKQDPSAIVEQSLRAIGYGKHIFSQPRSKEGTINFLSQHQSFGMSIVDEIGEFISDLTTKKDNITYQQLDAFLKEISTACKKEVTSGFLTDTNKKKNVKQTTLKYPVLSMLGATTPELYAKAFNSESLAGGLCQRFTPIVVDFEDLLPNPHANAQAIITCDIFESLKQTVVDEGDVPPLMANDSDSDSLCDPKDTAFRSPPVIMPITPNALALLTELDNHYRGIYNRLYREGDPTHAFYGRIAEKIERLATVISLEKLKIEDIEFAKTFIEHITTQQIASSSSTVLSTNKTREAMADEQRVLKVITDLVARSGSSTVLRRDVIANARAGGRFASSWEFDNVIKMLEELGKIETCKRKVGDAPKPTAFIILK